MAQFGTGSNLLGNTDALKAAMQSRGVDSSILDQVSSSSAAFNPSVASVGTNLPSMASPSAQAPAPTAPAAPDTDVSTIIKALTKYLGNTQKNIGIGSNQPSF